MSKIINTTELQKRVSHVAHNIQDGPYIVINRGVAKMVILPYFENCDDKVQDYFEEYLMEINKDKLKEQYNKSSKSGLSDLKV